MSFAFLGNQGDAFHHKFLIREIVRLVGCETYLELGVYDGETLDYIRPVVKRALGVDCKDLRKNKDSEFYQMLTDDFFIQYPDIKVDVAFIDADHRYESAKRDLLNVLTRLNKYGIVICHDSDPINKQYTDPGYCGDSYKLIDYIYKERPDLNVITLPVTETGISIIMRKDDRRSNLYS